MESQPVKGGVLYGDGTVHEKLQGSSRGEVVYAMTCAWQEEPSAKAGGVGKEAHFEPNS